MDRRSRLWRQKSSEKGPGETESYGSISSHSERFSDDQGYPIHDSQSPEVTSKAAPSDEEVNDNPNALTEKLSAALLSISVKEDLVKQHTKVAEEAVSGWEKAEHEVLLLKQQLEVITGRNSALEDRGCHLDGALKECVRQLRQEREEQEWKIQEAVTKRSYEWESTKSMLENQLVEIQAELKDAKTEAAASDDPDLRTKLEASENENLALKLKLLSQEEELDIRTSERDFSIQAAETASKQHLRSIKEVAKLEAEFHSLKGLACKVSPSNDYNSFTASSAYVESLADSQSDCGDRLQAVETDICTAKCLELNVCEPSQSGSWASAWITELDQNLGRKPMVPLIEISLMDDFLEMERLAAMPDMQSKSCLEATDSPPNQPTNGERLLNAELEAMINRTAELEENLENMETKKVELEMVLIEHQKQLETLKIRLNEAEVKLVELQLQLALANESKQDADEEIKAANTKREIAESQLRVVEAEIKSLHSKFVSLEEVVEKERILSAKSFAQCKKLEDEVLKGKCEELQHETTLELLASSKAKLKIKQEKELAVAASKFAECQNTIASLGEKLKSLAILEDFVD